MELHFQISKRKLILLHPSLRRNQKGCFSSKNKRILWNIFIIIEMIFGLQQISPNKRCVPLSVCLSVRLFELTA